MASGIYKITNLINWKIYVGSAIDIQDRWFKHTSTLNNKCHHNKHLQAAWGKYWPKNFRFDVLEYVEIELLENREQFWMDLLRANNRNFGYNKRLNARNNLGVKYSEESKARMSAVQMGRFVSEETKEKLRNRVITDEWRKNIAEGAKGKKHSDSARAKISAALYKRIRNPETFQKVAAKTRGMKRSLEQRQRMADGRKKAREIRGGNFYVNEQPPRKQKPLLILTKVLMKNENGEWV